MKKGVSPVIGAIILIVMVVTLGMVIFLWVRNYTSNIGEEVTGGVLCREMKFVIGDVCYEDIVVPEQGKKIKFSVINQASNVSIKGFLVALDYEGGIISNTTEEIDIENFVSQEVSTSFITNVETINRVRMIPKVEDVDGEYACEDKGLFFVWSEFEECS